MSVLIANRPPRRLPTTRLPHPVKQTREDAYRMLRRSYAKGDRVRIGTHYGDPVVEVSSESIPHAWYPVRLGVGCTCRGYARFAYCRHYARAQWVKLHGWDPDAPEPEEGAEG